MQIATEITTNTLNNLSDPARDYLRESAIRKAKYLEKIKTMTPTERREYEAQRKQKHEQKLKAMSPEQLESYKERKELQRAYKQAQELRKQELSKQFIIDVEKMTAEERADTFYSCSPYKFSKSCPASFFEIPQQRRPITPQESSPQRKGSTGSDCSSESLDTIDTEKEDDGNSIKKAEEIAPVFHLEL